MVLFILPKGGEIVNDENLIPLNKRSKKVQREIQEKGRQANKAKHAQKRTVRECLAILKDMPCTHDKIKKTLREAGIKDEEITNGMAIAFATFMNGMKNAQFARLAYEMMGENDVQGNTIINSAPPEINVNFVKADEK